MTDARLRQAEKNDVLRLIEQFRFDPSEFAWTDLDIVENQYRRDIPARISGVVHKPTQFFVRFGPIYVTFSPGPHFRVENEEHQHVWAVKLRLARVWLTELRKEVDTPDLWANIGQEKALSTAAASDVDNRPFTASEQSLIATELDEIKAYLLEGQQFAADQAETIEREFAYLKESAKRLGRKDWLNILLGGLFGLAVTLALDPEKARGLLQLAGAVFQSLWGVAQGVLQ